jgi:hypothetical protein
VALAGSTVVISPLIALQKDQAGIMQQQEVGGAAVVNSSIGEKARQKVFEDLGEGNLEFVFLAPEQLHKEEVLAHLRAPRPSLFVVDEAQRLQSQRTRRSSSGFESTHYSITSRRRIRPGLSTSLPAGTPKRMRCRWTSWKTECQ